MKFYMKVNVYHIAQMVSSRKMENVNLVTILVPLVPDQTKMIVLLVLKTSSYTKENVSQFAQMVSSVMSRQENVNLVHILARHAQELQITVLNVNQVSSYI